METLNFNRKELADYILHSAKDSFIEKVKALLLKESVDWWNDLSDEEKAEIEEGLKQIENGEVVSHESVMKQFEKWK